jgi:integrase
MGIGHYTLHSLRHTNISIQLAAGVPLVTVSVRAGHSRTSTTSDIYSHIINSSDKQAAETLNNLFSKKQNTEED